MGKEYVEFLHIVIDSATENNTSKLQTMINDDPRLVHVRDENGWQIIHLAAAKGQLNYVKILVELGEADINSMIGPTLNGGSVLWMVVSYAESGADHPVFSYLKGMGAQLISPETNDMIDDDIADDDMIDDDIADDDMIENDMADDDVVDNDNVDDRVGDDGVVNKDFTDSDIVDSNVIDNDIGDQNSCDNKSFNDDAGDACAVDDKVQKESKPNVHSDADASTSDTRPMSHESTHSEDQNDNDNDNSNLKERRSDDKSSKTQIISLSSKSKEYVEFLHIVIDSATENNTSKLQTMINDDPRLVHVRDENGW